MLVLTPGKGIVDVITITPKLKLSDDDKNVSLSWILKLRLLGNFLTIMSTQMMEAPMMHAAVTVSTHLSGKQTGLATHQHH